MSSVTRSDRLIEFGSNLQPDPEIAQKSVAMALWIIKAGQQGEHEEYFLANDLACLTFPSIPPIGHITSREKMIDFFLAFQPDATRRSAMSYAVQTWAFRGGCCVGDLLVMPLKSTAQLAVGQLASKYRYNPAAEDPYRHERDVVWNDHLIARRDLDADLRYTFTAKKTFCEAKRNDAEKRVHQLLNGSSRFSESPSGRPPDRGGRGGYELGCNLDNIAWRELKRYVEQNFTGHELAHLVAELLQIDGYHVYTSPEGPDGGCDILAARGSFGFDHPRICVQVKRTSRPARVEVLRALIGTMRMLQASHGILVSWSGFTQATHKEATQMYFNVRLIDGSDLLRNLVQHYDALPDSTKERLPLRQVWLVQEGQRLPVDFMKGAKFSVQFGGHEVRCGPRSPPQLSLPHEYA